nr:ASCH domain-containing protein [Actinotalea ferrariae]
MWADYCAAHPEAVHDEPEPVLDQFGDHAALADELLDLVLHGPKRATAALVLEFAAAGDPLPRVGSHWVVHDGAGRPRAVLRTVELRLGVAESVDEAFAWDEGESDRTRESWLREHRGYWERTCPALGVPWDEGHEVVFERFRVVWPPEVADRP